MMTFSPHATFIEDGRRRHVAAFRFTTKGRTGKTYAVEVDAQGSVRFWIGREIVDHFPCDVEGLRSFLEHVRANARDAIRARRLQDGPAYRDLTFALHMRTKRASAAMGYPYP